MIACANCGRDVEGAYTAADPYLVLTARPKVICGAVGAATEPLIEGEKPFCRLDCVLQWGAKLVQSRSRAEIEQRELQHIAVP